jgi:signal transduction histidine kinase/ActR/RegA family two-component response regulator
MSWGYYAGKAQHADRGPRAQQIFAAEVRLLYANANVGVAVTLIAATLLTYLQWQVVAQRVLVQWWAFMVLLSVARFTLARRYWARSPNVTVHKRWGAAFAGLAGLAGSGWGAAGILLYADAHLTNQVFLVFVLGGMMIGAASLLAPRPEAFLAFLIPAGLPPAARLLYAGDETHAAMGLLAAVFTIATVVTTERIHHTIDSSLRLHFENQDLVEELQTEKKHTEALNQQLELRVQERTAELHEANERLRAEIKQRELTEEELLRARKLESLGVLAGGIAHDFNNFLTVVSGNVEMIKIYMDSGESIDDVLDQISTACQRATFLSSQLLTFAKGGAPVRRVVSMADVVAQAVQLARAGTSVTFDVDIADDLWYAEVDQGQIGQVLHNILLNARQAMPDGGIIEVRAKNVEQRVRISIRDYGPGIPADVLPRIFDPYFTTKTGGSGLGLATAYAIVAKHDGQIDVQSVPGTGTVFTVDLPGTQERPLPESAAGAVMHRRTERLLVMDDEEALRTLLEGILTRLGYQVQSARDGAEAIALYDAARTSNNPFDAVLLDLTVSGGMGGIEAASKIKELDNSARLIVSSGYSDSPAMADFRSYGFDDVIPKPWSAAELSDVFRRVLVADSDREPR